MRDDLWYQNDTPETLFIEIDKDQYKKEPNIIIEVIYRHPDTDIDAFKDYFLQFWWFCWHIVLTFLFFSLITKPTRVTENSATTINNIFHDCYSEVSSSVSGILYIDVSDQFPIYHIDYSVPVCSKSKTFRKRILFVTSMECFSSAMSEKNRDSVLNDNDPQNAYTLFILNLAKCVMLLFR